MTDPDDRDTIKRLTPVPSGAPVTPKQDALPGADAEDKPGFDPFKFQRITLPPGLRADFFRWSSDARDEKVPEDTIPPHGGIVRTLPVRSTRGLVAGAAFVAIAALVALAVATLARGRAVPSAAASREEALDTGSSAAQALPALHDGKVAEPHPLPPEPPTTADPESEIPATSQAPQPKSKKPAPAVPHAESHRPRPTSERAPGVTPGESALDRPFSTPQ